LPIQSTQGTLSLSIVIIGPAHPLRGGLASYNERLARAFIAQGHRASIHTFSLQYPGFLFPGTTQYASGPPPKDLKIRVCINSVNPFNWIRIGKRLAREKPDIIVVRYWLPFMGPCLGTLLRQVRKNGHTRIVCIADNIIPHEKRPGDKTFTRYFLKAVDACITMSEKVLGDLHTLVPQMPARFVLHPLYDNFGQPLDRTEARRKLGIPEGIPLLLFFGFIRKYKGLDLLLEAIALVKDKHPQPFNLLVAGEYYEDSRPYLEQIEHLGIADHLILKTDFIPDDEVRYYLCAADMVVQPYRSATQSGVTPLAYHFEIPMIVTNVGGLPDLVPDGQVGLVAEPEPASIAEKIMDWLHHGAERFLPALRSEKKKYDWNNITGAVIELANPSP
jgi:glycosyltransferase involved in cell wall biosynthesis